MWEIFNKGKTPHVDEQTGLLPTGRRLKKTIDDILHRKKSLQNQFKSQIEERRNSSSPGSTWTWVERLVHRLLDYLPQERKSAFWHLCNTCPDGDRLIEEYGSEKMIAESRKLRLGSWLGLMKERNRKHVPHKGLQVTRISWQRGWKVDSFTFHFEDGTSFMSGVHGGGSGEDIILKKGDSSFERIMSV